MQPFPTTLLRCVVVGTLLAAAFGQSAAEAIATARRSLREIFAADFAKTTTEARRALASRLLGQAGAEAARFCRLALLCEARDLAADAGDLAICLRAAAALVEDADCDHGTQAAAVRRALGGSDAWPSQRLHALACLQLSDQTLLANGPDAARTMLDALEKAARRAGDKSMKGLLLERRSEIDQFLALRGPTLRPAEENALARGRYHCFGLGQWHLGLAELARSDDPSLRSLAAADLLGPVEAAAQFQLAGQWWDAADREGGQRFVWLRARQRAALWYEKALPGLSGTERLEAQRCIDDAKAPRQLRTLDAHEPEADGLVARWRFDEGSGPSATDDSGNGHVATLGGDTAWVPGLVGCALSFDGHGDHASVKLERAMPAAGEPQTLAWYQWVDAYPAQGFNSIALTAKGGKTSVQAGYRSGSPGRIIVWKMGGAILVETPAPSAKDWHHIAYVFTGSEHRLYIDGKLEAKSDRPNPGTQAHDVVEFGRWIGRDRSPFAGQLDEVRIYARALSPTEIRKLLRSDR